MGGLGTVTHHLFQLVALVQVGLVISGEVVSDGGVLLLLLVVLGCAHGLLLRGVGRRRLRQRQDTVLQVELMPLLLDLSVDDTNQVGGTLPSGRGVVLLDLQSQGSDDLLN